MTLEDNRIGSGLKNSPWIILGAAVILLVVVVVLSVQNANSERRHMVQVLSTKGAALIRAVEAGARTGMMGWRWGGRQVQQLLEETAKLPDVVYMAVIDASGKLLAHSNPSLIGQDFRPDRRVVHLGPEHQENWELVSQADGRRVFEVHRYFRPLPRGWQDRANAMEQMMRHHGADADDWFDPRRRHEQIIIVGLDVTPFENAIAGYIRHAVMLSVILLLLGFAGFVSLFWMQSYRAARRSLQDTSAFADEVVAHLPVGLVATDRNGRIASFNAGAERILGVQSRDALGRDPDEILPPQLCGLKGLLDEGRSIVEQEMSCETAGSGGVPVSISATRIANAEGRLVGHVLIMRDLGEVRGLQEQIRRQEKLAAIGGLAAGVAHEIRNPLSSIKGLATYLAGKFENRSEDHELAQVMTREVDRLNRVISELLEFARPTDLNDRPSDINDLIRRSLQLIQQDAAAKNVTVKQDLGTGLCSVRVDPDRIAQCLLNIYINAIQAMPGGGRLSVTSRPHGSAQQEAYIEIVDTGHGIAAADLGKIFDPYFTTKAKGTGLGLAIVHKIIEAHQGRILVDSTPDKGTRIRLILPCGTESDRGNDEKGYHPGGR